MINNSERHLLVWKQYSLTHASNSSGRGKSCFTHSCAMLSACVHTVAKVSARDVAQMSASHCVRKRDACAKWCGQMPKISSDWSISASCAARTLVSGDSCEKRYYRNKKFNHKKLRLLNLSVKFIKPGVRTSSQGDEARKSLYEFGSPQLGSL